MRLHPDALSPLALRAQARALYTLPAGQAHRWHARQAGELRVARGLVWLTFDGPHAGTEGGAGGDVFLHAGERLALPAGARPVLEAVATPQCRLADAAFNWHAAQPARLPRAVHGAAAWLAHALAAPAHMLARLAGGASWRA